jgi:hypothetical protein
VQQWLLRTYTGSNPQEHHLHISVQADVERFDDAADWRVSV